MLQFTQQQYDRQAKARMLGGLIRVNWIKAFGMLGLFEDWAANTGKPGHVPEGRLDGPRAPQMLAALLEYRGDAETLATAFCELGILERTATGLRATGLDERYGPMFEAAEKRSENASNAAKKLWADKRKAKEEQAQCAPDAPASEPHAAGSADAMPLDAKGNGKEIEGKEKEEREAQEPLDLEPTEADPAPAQHPLEVLWGNLANPALPRWAKLTPERRKRADARWKEHGPGGWRSIIAKVNAAPFLQGKKWFTLDWLLKPENLQKVLEGNFDDDAPTVPQDAPPLLRNCAVCDQASEGGAIGEGIFACYPHVAAFRANAERNGWERPWEHAAEWVEAVRAQEEVAA